MSFEGIWGVSSLLIVHATKSLHVAMLQAYYINRFNRIHVVYAYLTKCVSFNPSDVAVIMIHFGDIMSSCIA